MTVYVDEFPGSGWGKWQGGGHMTTSNLDELHALAKKIGLKRSWFQDGSIPHYDLTRNKRRLALENGAVEIDAFEDEFPPDTLMRNQDGTYEPHEERRKRYMEKHGEDLQDVRAT